MKLTMPVAAFGLCSITAAAPQLAVDVVPAKGAAHDDVVQFEKPVRLEAGGALVQVEAPGYAAPCWTDVDGDGHGDLVVGQFAGGKMKVYRGDARGKLAAGTWLEADGKVAEVPGVW